MTHPHCPLPTDWDLIGPSSDPQKHLLSEITFGAVAMHVEAIRVEPHLDAAGNDTGYQGSYLHDLDAILNQLVLLVEADEPFQTTQIDGFPGEYVVFIYPHC
jgi:hypothetical protein